MNNMEKSLNLKTKPKAELHIEVSLDRFATRKYKTYGIAVLEDRAIPDFRDGMNPVNRRVLWSAYELGIRSNSKFVKSARIVGDTLGRYHPHGDCLRGNTRIPLLNGKTTTIKKLVENGSGKKWVLSYDKKTKAYVPALAYAWRVGQTTKAMYQVTLTNGEMFEATGNHRFFTTKGEISAEYLSRGACLIGGQLTQDEYRRLSLPVGNEHLHKIVAEYKHGPLEDRELYHHLNQDKWDNRPNNFEVRSRTEHHYEHLDDSLLGLSNGRQTMFAGDSKMRKAIKTKNSRLMSEYNKQLAIIKAFKGVQLLKARGVKVNPQTYNTLRKEKVIYNLTSLETLAKRGYTLMRIVHEKEFKLDTSAARGLTQALKVPKEKLERQIDVIGSPFWSSVAIVVRVLVRHYKDNELTWDLYEKEARALCGSANASKVVYTSKSRIQEHLGVVSFKQFLSSIPTKFLTLVSSVKRINLTAKEDFYDFTVDKYENMIICPAKNVSEDSDTFIVVHNSSCYGAMVGMTNVGKTINNVQCGLLEGEGNWGSFSDKSYAAHRYTEARLSRFSDEILFNKFYLPVVEKGPNFDSSGKEPVILPALLPIVFLNGRFGIAPGAQTSIPSFEFKSVLKTLKAIYEGEDITAKLLYKGLKVSTLFGGVERLDTATKEERLERLSMFKTMTGKVMMYGNPVYNEKDKTIIANRFGSSKVNVEKLISNIGSFEGVQSVLDDSSKGEKYGTLKINLRRNLTTQAYVKLLKRVDVELSSRENYILNFTERYLDAEGQAQARMKPQSITEAFTNWVAWRIDLEQKACAYWIAETLKQIRRLELLMIAVDNRKLIIESLDKDLDQEALEDWLAKKLKITKQEAAFIYDLKVRQLRKLERKGLEAQMKEVLAKKKDLEHRKAKPLPYMAAQLKDYVHLLD